MNTKQQTDYANAGLASGLAAFSLGVPLSEVGGATRGRAEVAFARQVAMYLAHVSFEMSLARVASAFRRDRSTVAHACHLIEDKRDEPDFDHWMEALEAAVQAAPTPRITVFG